jgi:hypothetical protein
MSAIDEPQLARALTAALEAIERVGVPRAHVLVGITADRDPDPDGDGTPYVTHVGAAQTDDLAVLLVLVAKDVLNEANRASPALYRGQRCPACESRRYAVEQRVDPPWLYRRNRCLDCHHETPWAKAGA